MSQREIRHLRAVPVSSTIFETEILEGDANAGGKALRPRVGGRQRPVSVSEAESPMPIGSATPSRHRSHVSSQEASEAMETQNNTAEPDIVEPASSDVLNGGRPATSQAPVMAQRSESRSEPSQPALSDTSSRARSVALSEALSSFQSFSFAPQGQNYV